jgi:3-hydroxybutyryl-CoA dehydrogenase
MKALGRPGFRFSKNCEVVNEFKTQRERSAARVCHWITQACSAGARCRNNAAVGQHGSQCLKHGAVFQHGPQVQWRIADKVHHSRLRYRLGVIVEIGVSSAKHHSTVDGNTKAFTPSPSSLDRPARMFECVSRGQDHDLGGLSRGNQPGIKLVVGYEGSAAEQRKYSGHGRQRTSRLPMLPTGKYGEFMTNQTAEIGIVGSGIMGSGLAEVAAKAGFNVVVRSRTRQSADEMLALFTKGITKQVERGKLSADESSVIIGRVRATDQLSELGDCQIVIESVVEDLAVKRELFTQLAQVARPDAILATNTSTLPVVELAIMTKHPELVCGIHFFNPAPAMSLVEIVRPLTADETTITAAKAFAAACGKDAVEVDDRAGFIVNALLFPYLNNAVRLAEQGTAKVCDIDTAMKGGCNFPMGPFALLDLVGLDTSVAILDALYEEFRDANYAAVPLLRRMVSAGQLGRKSGKGFYEYRR